MSTESTTTIESVAIPAPATAHIPRVVRCPRCGDLARAQVWERNEEGDAAVRYGCPSCRWRQTRHYHEQAEPAHRH